MSRQAPPPEALVKALECGTEQLTLLEVMLADFHDGNQEEVHDRINGFVRSLHDVKQLSRRGELAAKRVPRDLLKQLDSDHSNPDLMLREKLADCATALDSASRRENAVAVIRQELQAAGALSGALSQIP